MSTNKLPKGAPPIPKGWKYRGTMFHSEEPTLWAFWSGGREWAGVHDKNLSPLVPYEGYHYITPIKRPAKKPAQATGKRVVKAVKALKLWSCAELEPVPVLSRKRVLPKDGAYYLLPADADSVARMTEQVAEAIYNEGHTRCQMSVISSIAQKVLSSLGIKGGKGARK